MWSSYIISLRELENPQGMKEARWRLEDYEKEIIYCNNEYIVIKKANPLVLLTE